MGTISFDAPVFANLLYHGGATQSKHGHLWLQKTNIEVEKYLTQDSFPH